MISVCVSPPCGNALLQPRQHDPTATPSSALPTNTINQHNTTATAPAQFDSTPNATPTFVTLAALAATTTMLMAAPLGNQARHSGGLYDDDGSPTSSITCPSATSSVVGSTVSAITTRVVPPSKNKQILQYMTNATDTKITYEYTTHTPPPPPPTSHLPPTTSSDVNDDCDATGPHSGGMHVNA